MRELLSALAARGTLVAPDAAEALRDEAGRWGEALLARRDLPFVLTRADLERLATRAPGGATVPAGPAESPPAPENHDAGGLHPRGSPPAEAAPTPLPPAAAAAPAVVVEPPRPAPAAAPAAPAPFSPDSRGMLLDAPEPPASVAPRRVAGPREPRPRGEAYTHQFEVLADVTGNSTCDGAITDFTRYFNDRLSKIRKMLRQRREMVGHVPMKAVRQGAQAEIKIIGLVTEVRTTKNGHRLIEIEDDTGHAVVLAPANNPNLVSAADTVIEDEVVGLVCKPAGKGDLLILDRVVRPDVPVAHDKRGSSRASAVAFVSDIHFGSKTFLAEDWDRFVRWINGDFGDSRMKALAKRTKYLVVNGDVVDGIGIFPGQEDELAIPDAHGQYEHAGRELERIREDVKIFVLPGNHDMVRPAEPQPALPEKYRKLFSDTVTHVGNPVKLSIEGVEILSYHGRSMDDWITRVSGLSYERPIEAMREMVQRRHVCPVYGLRTPLAPEHKDFLVIDTVPDVFITGHVHSAGVESYRGVTLINASCWQSQTAYQKMHGFNPDPGKVAVVELDTQKPWMLDFHRGKPAGVDVVGKSHLGTADPKVVPEF